MSEQRERPRYQGFLTPDDKEAIEVPTFGNHESEHIGENRQARFRIRERTKQALWDLCFLFYHLPERDRRQIFDEFMYGRGREALIRTVRLLFLGIYDNADSFEYPYDEDTHDPIDVIEWFVREGIGGAEWELGGYQSDVFVDIEVDRWRPDPDAAYDRLFSGYADHMELVYLEHWCEDYDVLERVIESGESLRIVRGPASKYGSECLEEFTPEDAREWR